MDSKNFVLIQGSTESPKKKDNKVDHFKTIEPICKMDEIQSRNLPKTFDNSSSHVVSEKAVVKEMPRGASGFESRLSIDPWDQSSLRTIERQRASKRVMLPALRSPTAYNSPRYNANRNVIVGMKHMPMTTVAGSVDFQRGHRFSMTGASE